MKVDCLGVLLLQLVFLPDTFLLSFSGVSLFSEISVRRNKKGATELLLEKNLIDGTLKLFQITIGKQKLIGSQSIYSIDHSACPSASTTLRGREATS